MRLLIVGNSQAGVLKMAYDAGTSPLGFTPFFYVVPGGSGPYLRVSDNRLVLTSQIDAYPPRIEPEGADAALTSFDAIVVSALGYVDGGFAYQNLISKAALMAEFGPRTSGEIVSEAVYRVMIQEGLARQSGFLFLNSLRAAYDGPIIVQPFPRPSEALRERADWGLRIQYDDPIGMHRFLEVQRDAYLLQTAEDLNVTLLPQAFEHPLWSPAASMRDLDLIHAGPSYGSRVLAMVDEVLAGL